MGPLNLIGLDSWIEGDNLCTYCGQRRCVCDPPEKERECECILGLFNHRCPVHGFFAAPEEEKRDEDTEIKNDLFDLTAGDL